MHAIKFTKTKQADVVHSDRLLGSRRFSAEYAVEIDGTIVGRLVNDGRGGYRDLAEWRVHTRTTSGAVRYLTRAYTKLGDAKTYIESNAATILERYHAAIAE